MAMPIYKTIENDLKKLINESELKSGDLVPSENELKEKYAVSRMTVRQALNNLVNDGYLYRHKGKGTFISQRKIEKNIHGVRSFTEEMAATNRCQPDRVSLKEKVDLTHEAKLLAMADISTFEEAIFAESIGFDLVSTTLSGYTPYSRQDEGPDIELVGQLVKTLKIPVIAEGRIATVEHLKAIKEQNPFAIVVGSAITRPQMITKRFFDAYNE